MRLLGCPHTEVAVFPQREGSKGEQGEATISFVSCLKNRALSLPRILLARGESFSCHPRDGELGAMF